MVDVYTLLYLKWITNKDILCSTWNSAQCHGAAWMGGGLAGEWIYMHVCIHIYMAECLCCSPETITILFVSQLYSNLK